MNSTQYGYHPYPSPSQTQAQVPQQQQQTLSPQQQHQQQVLSPQQHQQQLQHPSDTSSQQQQLSPQQSPSSSHHHSPEQQHASNINLDHNGHSSNTSNSISTPSNSANANNGNHLEQHHSPAHSNIDAQSPIDAEGELIVPVPGAPQIQQNGTSVASGTLHSPPPSQGHTTLLPMPSPALAAATAANTAANTNPSANRQMIIQQYQQQQQQHQNQLNMGMSMPMQQGAPNGGNPGTINTMMSLHGPAPYMLPSPQSAGGQSSLPALPPQSTDLDSILAKYANQPELLKLIIASKTEEDRRWAEEARYRMMDLIMRGDNRGAIMASFEALGGTPGNMPGMMGMPLKRLMEEGYVHPSFGGFPPSGPGLGAGGPGSGGAPGPGSAPGSAGGLPGLNPSSTSAGSSSAGFPSMYAQSPMPNAFGMGMGGMHGSQPMMNQAMGGGPNGFGQYVDPSLARKRSVTFAGEVHHMRSQSLSSMPSPSGAGQLGGMSMLGMGGGSDAFGQHQQQQQPNHQQQGGGLQSSQQYQFQQQQAQPQQMHFHHHSSQSFSGTVYPHQPFGQQHTLPSLNHHGVIRRTNSLSHLPQTQITVTEPRLVAGRPRNDSSASIRTMDDDNSDEDSDDDYDNHPVTGGMASRPGSALSMHNNIGGNHETSLTLEFSDMASVSGHHHHHGHDHHGDQGQANSSSSFNNNSSGGSHAKGHRSTSSMSSISGIAGAGTAGPDCKRKRKRREMQPVNKIVESSVPHVDPYLWKNNGNTTQKKTGCKSIYYKCSNSTAGCTVNKTVTEREGGGFMTKYRGEHLDDCNRLKRAQQLAHQPAHNGHLPIQNEQ